MSNLYGKRVKVYRNLRNKCLSVMYKGIVIAHVSDIYLEDVTYQVRESGRQLVLKQKRKNVHAFVIGTVRRRPKTVIMDEYIFYNPYMNKTFVLLDNTPILTSKRARLRMTRVLGKKIAEITADQCQA